MEPRIYSPHCNECCVLSIERSVSLQKRRLVGMMKYTPEFQEAVKTNDSCQEVQNVAKPFMSDDMEIYFKDNPSTNRDFVTFKELASPHQKREIEYFLELHLTGNERTERGVSERKDWLDNPSLIFWGEIRIPILPNINMNNYSKGYDLILDTLLRGDPLSLEKVRHRNERVHGSYEETRDINKSKDWRLARTSVEHRGENEVCYFVVSPYNPTKERVIKVAARLEPVIEKLKDEKEQKRLVDATTVVAGTLLYLDKLDVRRPEEKEGHVTSDFGIRILQEEYEGLLRRTLSRANEILFEIDISREREGLKEVILDE